MTLGDSPTPRAGTAGFALSLLTWSLFLALQRSLPIPTLQLSPGWRWGMTLLFATDTLATIVWSLRVLLAAQRDQRLASTGPYAVVRHPIYSALLWGGTAAVAFAFQAWLVLLAALPLHLIWIRLALMEEQWLIAFFGEDYQRYAARTGRFLPRRSQFTTPPGDSPEISG
ncbi:MAG: isoprenylcysteine carboxylmethyltransferase family protein [Candidatus Marinimicrobia bacterium]|nr:isoprenylcysteine carboxylmethyltransferase family protein [Candidatus Neomarinimicrobiota bacterium]